MKRSRRDMAIPALLLTASAVCVFALLYRPPVFVSGTLTVNSIRFETLPPVHSRGVFASDNRLDLSIADFATIRSVAPASPVVIESGADQSLLRLTRARLESLEVVHPVSVWLSIADDSLRMLVRRRRGIADPFCRVRVYANSGWQCGGCRDAPPGKKTPLPIGGESVIYDVYPRDSSLQLAILLDQAKPLPPETGIPVAGGSNLTFLNKERSSIVEGALTLGSAPPLKLERGDWVEVFDLQNAEINRMEAFAGPLSRIAVVFAGRAGSTRYGKTSGTLSDLNPTLLETFSGNGSAKAFEFACKWIGSISGVFGLLTSLKFARRARIQKKGKQHATKTKAHAG